MRKAIIGLLSLTLLVFASCGNTPSSTTSTPTASTAYAQVGQVVSVSGWQITITRAQVLSRMGMSMPRSTGDRFLLIDLTMQNMTNHSQEASSLAYGMRGTDGMSYEQAMGMAGITRFDGPVAAGAMTRGQVCWEVAGTMHDFILSFMDRGGHLLAMWNIAV